MLKLNKKLKLKVILASCLCLLIILGLFLYNNAKANVYALLEEKMKTYASLASSYAINKVFDGITYNEFYNVSVDDNGSITLVSANSTNINVLLSKLQREAQNKLVELCERKIELPLGVFFGVSSINAFGPMVTLPVCLRSGATSCEFTPRFLAAGINQTKHSLYIDIVSSVSSIFSPRNEYVNVKTSALICETIIVGKIPDGIIIRNVNQLDLVP